MLKFSGELLSLAKGHMQFFGDLGDLQQQQMALDIISNSFLATVLQPAVILLFQIAKRVDGIDFTPSVLGSYSPASLFSPCFLLFLSFCLQSKPVSPPSPDPVSWTRCLRVCAPLVMPWSAT